jgi:hypothetical protein
VTDPLGDRVALLSEAVDTLLGLMVLGYHRRADGVAELTGAREAA